MRVVYDAENLLDAHLVKHALESIGIPAFVRGEYLTGAMGELPMHGLLQVCVPEPAWAEAEACVRELALCRVAASAKVDVGTDVGSGSGADSDAFPDDGLLA